MFLSFRETTPNDFLPSFDAQEVEDLVLHEEHKLKVMQFEFLNELGLFQAQLKLICALKSFLALLTKPAVSPQELLQQFSTIISLYHDVDKALLNAQKHKDNFLKEIQDQEKEQLLLRMKLADEQAHAKARAGAAYAAREKERKVKQEREEKKERKEKEREEQLAQEKARQQSILQHQQRIEMVSALNLIKVASPFSLHILNCKLKIIFQNHRNLDRDPSCKNLQSLEHSRIKLSFMLTNPKKANFAKLLAQIKADLVALEKAHNPIVHVRRHSPFALPKPFNIY